MPENALDIVRRSWSGAFLSADEDTFDAAVRKYIYAARTHDMPIERTIARLKQELHSLTPIEGDFKRAGELVERAVQLVIAEYYEAN
ncbi:MAG TPA: hypothetical protein VJ672_10320 [Gemmatimonadaceae bacterium]|nr:hypothetical protein [Gemmatimonadaceae bacterium]